jgi:hypothetical protein
MRAVTPIVGGDSTIDSTASNSRSSKSVPRISLRRASTDVNTLIVDAKEALRQKEEELKSIEAR